MFIRIYYNVMSNKGNYPWLECILSAFGPEAAVSKLQLTKRKPVIVSSVVLIIENRIIFKSFGKIVVKRIGPSWTL